jgi:hypothetical protein
MCPQDRLHFVLKKARTLGCRNGLTARSLGPCSIRRNQLQENYRSKKAIPVRDT